MELHYLDTGFCQQTAGFPATHCQVVTGIRPEHTHWCQTVACDYAVNECGGGAICESVALPFIISLFSPHCRIGELEVGFQPAATTTSTASTTTTTTTTTRTTTTSIFTTTSTTRATTSTTTPPVSDGGCWAPINWSGGACQRCAAPQGNACPAFSWTVCHSSERDCNLATGGGGGCAGECRANTLGMSRPSFLGPSCYNSEYGSQFGPNWVPTGRTRFEQLVPSPTKLHHMIQTTDDDLPWLQKSWGWKGCDAAAAVYENVVCSIEIMHSLNRQFEGTRGGAPGYFITDFANTGDDQTDRRELVAFFSHKFKETARLQVWEEAAVDPYADCTNVNFPCQPGARYHGRGPVQISWNFNYGPFSEWFYGDKMILLRNPERVDPEGPMGFIAAFWFWMTPRDFTSGAPISGSIRTRDAIIHWTDGKMNALYNDGRDYDAVAGLGLSTNVINGGIECRGGSDSPLWRVIYYLTVAARMGVNIPDMNNDAACRADRLCNGLFSGCSSSARGATCEPAETLCGPTFVRGWQTRLCQAR